MLSREVVVEKLIEEIPVLCSDLNRTLLYVDRIPKLRSIKNYANSAAKSVAHGDTKKPRVYVSEYLKDILSDDKIGKFKPAACRVFLHGVKESDFLKANTELIGYHRIPYVKDFLTSYKNCGEDKKIMLVSRHPFPNPFVKHFDFDEYVTNDTCFESDGRFAGFYMPIRTGIDKLMATEKKLNEIGLNVSDCAVMVDGINDVPLIRKSALSLASPLSNPKVSRIADYHIKNFNEFAILADMLKEKCMPELETLNA